jgi:hypothetical protein
MSSAVVNRVWSYRAKQVLQLVLYFGILGHPLHNAPIRHRVQAWFYILDVESLSLFCLFPIMWSYMCIFFLKNPPCSCHHVSRSNHTKKNKFGIGDHDNVDLSMMSIDSEDPSQNGNRNTQIGGALGFLESLVWFSK